MMEKHSVGGPGSGGGLGLGGGGDGDGGGSFGIPGGQGSSSPG